MSDKIMKIIGLPIYYVTHLTPKLGYIIIRIELLFKPVHVREK